MKKLYIFPSLAIVAMGVFAFQTSRKTGMVEAYKVKEHMMPGGGQSGLTGAPGESNCTQCHSGSALDGSSENIFELRDANLSVVTYYIPGQTYTATLRLASDPLKKGFSSTVLDASNDMAGSLAEMGIGGTQDFQNVGGTIDYVSHTDDPGSNTNANMLWSWTWNAPATEAGDVTFYIASNVANNNNLTSGDQIYLSQHVITSSLGIEDKEVEAVNFNAGYAVEGHKVTVNFNSLVAGDMYFNLVDLNGKSVYTKQMDKALIGENHEVIALPQELKNGMYVVNFFVGNKAMSGKIMVQR